MRGADATALAQLAAGGNQVVAQVDLVNTFGTTNSDPVFASTDPTRTDKIITVVDGDFSQDDTRDILTESNITIAVDDEDIEGWIPLNATSPLAPVSATEYQLYLGFMDPATNTPLLGSIGLFDFSTTTIERDGGSRLIKLTGFDRSRKLTRAKFARTYNIAANSYYTSIIQYLVSQIMPNVKIMMTASTHLTPHLSYDASVDLTFWDVINKLADAIGYSVWFDNLGRCQIQPTMESDADPQWQISEATNVSLLRSQRTLSDEKAYNGVIIRGEAVSSGMAPVQGEAWDLNANSPTYYDPNYPELSKYGPVPLFEVSDVVVNSGQAAIAAQARLPKVMGMDEKVGFDTRFNPYIEVGDVVNLDFSDINASGNYVVETVSSSIHADTMRVTTRERKQTKPL